MSRLLTKKEVEELKRVEEEIKELKKVEEEFKKKIIKKMNSQDLKKVELDDIIFTLKDSYTRVDLDKKNLEKDFPEIVKKYSKETIVKESLLIKF